MTEFDARVRSLVASGDAIEAATLVLRELGPAILGFLSAVLGDTEADEVFSAFSERLWRSLSGFRADLSLRTWAYILARQEIGRYRLQERQHRQGRVQISELSSIIIRAAQTRSRTTATGANDGAQRLAALRDELPVDDRTLLILRIDQEMSFDDIALVMSNEPGLLTATDRRRESARLRKRFQLIRQQLIARIRDAASGESETHGSTFSHGDRDGDRQEPIAQLSAIARVPSRRPRSALAPDTLWGPSGRYIIQRQLGRGGMGTVYAVTDTTLNRVIALKVLDAAGFGPDAAEQVNLLREAEFAARMEHERIARVYGVGAYDGYAFVAMEYVPGDTLRAWMAGRDVSAQQIMDIASQIAEGLAELHGKGVIHRDLKPENVMLTPQGAVKLLDFGLARNTDAASGASQGQSVQGGNRARAAGTPGYMAPEQWEGRAIDARADVFALGVIIHELVTGQRLFRGPTKDAIASATRAGMPSTPDPRWSRVPERLLDHTARMLAPDPGARFADGAHVLAVLRDFAADFEMTPSRFTWPAAPYKGLNHYDSGDVPLLAGRDEDITQCARTLGDNGTRIVLLHGLTACGKSSFLRAGLIPYLEGSVGGFQFLRDADPGSARALFIRSTHAPLPRVAKAIYDLATVGVGVRTPRGQRRIDLTPVLMGCTDLESFCADVSGNTDHMHKALALLGERLPRTLVFVVDQGEEALTQRPGRSGDRYRSEFFEFLADFTRTDLDLRVLVALRTEYYGRFNHELRLRVADAARVQEFYLATLDRAAIALAIERPSLDTSVGDFGVPRHQYRFSYEAGLPLQIATDLEAASPAGGVLPAMQIVCGRLYEQTRNNEMGTSGSWQIAAADYARLGGVSGQLRTHLNDALAAALLLIDPDMMAMDDLRREHERWQDVLSGLVRSQADGSVTTEIRSEQELTDTAREIGCTAPFSEVMKLLCTDGLRICRRVEVMRRDLSFEEASSISERGDLIVCYALGHDAIGLALKQWLDVRGASPWDFGPVLDAFRQARGRAGVGLHAAGRRDVTSWQDTVTER